MGCYIKGLLYILNAVIILHNYVFCKLLLSPYFSVAIVYIVWGRFQILCVIHSVPPLKPVVGLWLLISSLLGYRICKCLHLFVVCAHFWYVQLVSIFNIKFLHKPKMKIDILEKHTIKEQCMFPLYYLRVSVLINPNVLNFPLN